MASYDWLPLEECLRWLKVTHDTPQAGAVDSCRQAAADWIQDQRPDLIVDKDLGTFAATPAIIQAGLLATARLYARQGSPAGLASYGEFGAVEVLRLDPDVTRLLGLDRPSQRPRIG